MSRPTAPRPFPLDPLLEAARTTGADLAERLHISYSTFHRARTQGITVAQADTWACRLGRHPAEVWPDWYEQTGGTAA